MDIVYLESGREKEILDTLDTLLISNINLFSKALTRTADDNRTTLHSSRANQDAGYCEGMRLCAAIVEYFALSINYINKNKFGI
jgi:hypothetical protein